MEKEGTKKKMCWMATLSSLCLLSLPVVWIVAWVIDSSGIKVDDWLSTTVAIFVGILLELIFLEFLSRIKDPSSNLLLLL